MTAGVMLFQVAARVSPKTGFSKWFKLALKIVKTGFITGLNWFKLALKLVVKAGLKLALKPV